MKTNRERIWLIFLIVAVASLVHGAARVITLYVTVPTFLSRPTDTELSVYGFICAAAMLVLFILPRESKAAG